MGFSYLSNRNLALFSAALEPLGGKAWSQGQQQVDLLYFDTYGGKRPPQGLEAACTLFDRRRSIPLDHKLQLARRMVDNGLHFPRHYFHPDQVPDEPDSWWYVKDPLSTGSKRVWLCQKQELEKYFQINFVIQEAIQDVALYLGRKFTLRTYVLVHGRIVYWYPDSFLVLHGAPYRPGQPDPAAHFSHVGYMEPGSEIRLLPSMDYRPYYKLELPIVETIQNVFGLYETELGKDNPPGTYCLFGLDFLHCQDGRVALIEINDRPNLHHNGRVNQLVNIPMLQAMVSLLLPEKAGPAPGKHFDELMFYE
jgi:hypothetical protein